VTITQDENGARRVPGSRTDHRTAPVPAPPFMPTLLPNLLPPPAVPAPRSPSVTVRRSTTSPAPTLRPTGPLPLAAPGGRHRADDVRRGSLAAGTALLLTTTGLVLGVMGVPPGGLWHSGTGGVADPVAGVAGLFPGGPAQQVSITVSNTAPSSFEITDVRPDLSALPAACPASAWHPDPPDQLPTVAAHAQATVTVPVSLLPDAPDSCQGLSLRLPVRVHGLRHPKPEASTPAPASAAGRVRAPALAPALGPALGPGAGPAVELRETSADAEARLTTATLATPEVSVTAAGGVLVLTPRRPAAGPRPAAWTVEALAPDGTRTRLPSEGGTYPDRLAPAAAQRRYVVTATLGARWERPSAMITASTPPPRPTLTSARAADGQAQVRLAVGVGAQSYQVGLFRDGASAPFRVVAVGAGTAGEQPVELPPSGGVEHRVVAVARFGPWQVTSAQVTVSASGSARTGDATGTGTRTWTGTGTGTGTGGGGSHGRPSDPTPVPPAGGPGTTGGTGTTRDPAGPGNGPGTGGPTAVPSPEPVDPSVPVAPPRASGPTPQAPAVPTAAPRSPSARPEEPVLPVTG